MKTYNPKAYETYDTTNKYARDKYENQRDYTMYGYGTKKNRRKLYLIGAAALLALAAMATFAHAEFDPTLHATIVSHNTSVTTHAWTPDTLHFTETHAH